MQARHKVAGVVLRCPGGVRFFFSDAGCRMVEDGISPDVRAVARSADRLGVAA
jgi:hypothetical protein